MFNDEVNNQVWNLVNVKASNQVRKQAYEQVQGPVWEQVNIQVVNQVRVQVLEYGKQNEKV